MHGRSGREKSGPRESFVTWPESMVPDYGGPTIQSGLRTC
jgi:hypothetical protein